MIGFRLIVMLLTCRQLSQNPRDRMLTMDFTRRTDESLIVIQHEPLCLI